MWPNCQWKSRGSADSPTPHPRESSLARPVLWTSPQNPLPLDQSTKPPSQNKRVPVSGWRWWRCAGGNRPRRCHRSGNSGGCGPRDGAAHYRARDAPAGETETAQRNRANAAKPSCLVTEANLSALSAAALCCFWENSEGRTLFSGRQGLPCLRRRQCYWCGWALGWFARSLSRSLVPCAGEGHGRGNKARPPVQRLLGDLSAGSGRRRCVGR